jgi:hypothetical protein
MPGCAAGGSTKLPAGAPALEPGVWKKISPPAPFGVVPNTFTQGLALDPCNAGVMYVGVDGFDVKASMGGLYKTTDAGATWARIGTPNLDEPVRVRVDPRNPQHLYVGDGVRGGTLGFWVSNDGGATWTMPPAFKALSAMGFVSDVYDVAPDPADFAHVLVTSHSPWGGSNSKWNNNSGVLESKDGGATWIVHDPFAGAGYGNNIWFLGDGRTWLLGTQGHGFWRTADAGATWTKVTDNSMQHGGGSLYRTKSGVLYAGGTPHMMRSADNGLSWTMIGPYSGINAVWGDGSRLYSGVLFQNAAWLTAPEEAGTPWTNYDGGTQKFTSGPFEMAFDAANGILYSASWGEGVLALKVVKP